MNLKLTKSADKFLRDLDAKQFRQIGLTILGLLRNPEPHDSQAMKGAKHGERRVDVGEYRVVYAIAGEVIEILVVGKRNDDEVYEIWKRMS